MPPGAEPEHDYENEDEDEYEDEDEDEDEFENEDAGEPFYYDVGLDMEHFGFPGNAASSACQNTTCWSLVLRKLIAVGGCCVVAAEC